MKPVKPVIDDKFFRELIWNSPWIADRELYILSTLCSLLDEYPSFARDKSFLSYLDNVLFLFAAHGGRWDYFTNRKLIYNRNILQILVLYGSDGLDYLKSLIHQVKGGRLMRQVFPLTSNPLNLELLDIILENDSENGAERIFIHLTDNGIFDDRWRLMIARDIGAVRNGERDWLWFYEEHCRDAMVMEPFFTDDHLRAAWKAFDDFYHSGYTPRRTLPPESMVIKSSLSSSGTLKAPKAFESPGSSKSSPEAFKSPRSSKSSPEAPGPAGARRRKAPGSRPQETGKNGKKDAENKSGGDGQHGTERKTDGQSQ